MLDRMKIYIHACLGQFEDVRQALGSMFYASQLVVAGLDPFKTLGGFLVMGVHVVVLVGLLFSLRLLQVFCSLCLTDWAGFHHPLPHCKLALSSLETETYAYSTRNQ